MAAQLFNNITDVLLNPVDTSQTEIQVQSGNVPSIDAGDWIPLYVIRDNGSFEIMHVTEVDGSTLTVSRGMEGTDPLVFESGVAVQVRPTRQSLSERDVSQNEVTSSTGTETVAEALDARVNKGELSQQLTAAALSGSKDFKLSTQLTRRINIDEFSDHKAFPVSVTDENGKIFIFYREADGHALSETGKMRMTTSDDGGYSWSPSVVVYDDPDRDIRAYGPIITPTGKIIVWAEAVRRVGTAGQQYDNITLTSVDGGDTWAYRKEFGSDSNRVTTFGRGLVIGSRLIQSFYRTPSNAFVTAISEDDGDTWSVAVPITSFPGSSIFTEPYLVHIGGGRIIGVARDNSADDAPALYFKSSDSGSTWSSVSVWPKILLGRNPPALYYSDVTGMVSLIWPSRGNRMESGGTGLFWPWYIAYGDADTIFDNGFNHMRLPWALPITGPYFTSGAADGDQGYGHIIDTPNGTMMTYYMGDADSPESSDIYMTNLSMVIEGIL